MSADVKLPKGVSVRIGAREFKGAIPEELCPDRFKPPSKTAAKASK